METMKAIAKRKSTRNFDPDKKVPQDLLDTVLKAGCAAPIGAGDKKSLHLTVVQDQEFLNEVNKAASAAFKREANCFYGAPVVVFVSAGPEQLAPNIQYCNTACVIENMLISATDAGLGCIYLWGPVGVLAANKELCAKLQLPEGFVPVSAAAIGYAKDGEPEERELSVSIGMNCIG